MLVLRVFFQISSIVFADFFNRLLKMSLPLNLTLSLKVPRIPAYCRHSLAHSVTDGCELVIYLSFPLVSLR